MLDVTVKGPSPGKLRSLLIFAIVYGDSGQTSSRPFLNGLEQMTSSVTRMEPPPRPHRHSPERALKSPRLFHTQAFGAKGRCPSSVASGAALRRWVPLEHQQTWARRDIVFLSPAQTVYTRAGMQLSLYTTTAAAQ